MKNKLIIEKWTEIEFKQAIPIDSTKIKELSRRVIQTNYPAFLGEGAVREFIDSGMADKEIDDNIANCTIMMLDGAILGFAVVIENLLHLIMIDTPNQNKGYGSVLIKHIEQRLFESYTEIHLQTFEDNSNALQFYLKNGWAIKEKQYVDGLKKTMLVLKKEI